MGVEDVKATETADYAGEQSGYLIYKGTLSALDTWIGYVFTNGLFTRARYSISKAHTNRNDYIDDYATLKGQLVKKYGNPLSDQTNWKNDLYKSDRTEWGFAISLGHLSYYSKWETPRTEIVLALFGDNYEISLIIEYTSKELGAIEQQTKQSEDLSNF
jgi:hypothetical protein